MPLPMQTAPHILSRSARHPAQDETAGLPFLGDLRLAPARVHEFCGRARRTLALCLARHMHGPVFWVHPVWLTDRLNADGVAALIDPGRLLFVAAKRPDDTLWVMEEVLRSGATPLVVADLPDPPGLTAVRRLHLAAEAGAVAGKRPATGLLLTPGEGGAQGVESRWALAHAHTGDARGRRGWQLERRRARTAPQKSWMVTQGERGPELCPKA